MMTNNTIQLTELDTLFAPTNWHNRVSAGPCACDKILHIERSDHFNCAKCHQVWMKGE